VAGAGLGAGWVGGGRNAAGGRSDGGDAEGAALEPLAPTQRAESRPSLRSAPRSAMRR
jgi:hypothetical protein